MKRLFSIIFGIFCLSGTIVGVSSAASANPAIESISISADAAKPEQIVFKLNGSYTPSTFSLDGERPRLVFDFHNVGYTGKANQIKGAGGKIIAGIRVGRHNDPLKTRVVVDIQKNTAYQYDQTFNVSTSSLVVSFQSGAPEGLDSKEQQRTAQAQHLVVGNVKIVHSVSEKEKAVDSTTSKPEKEDSPVEKQPEPDNKTTTVVTPEPPKKTTVVPPEPPKKATVVPPEPPKKEAVDEKAPDSEKSPETEPAEAPVEKVEKTEDSGVTAPAEQTPVVKDDPSKETAQETPVLLDVSFEQSINQSETVLFRLNHFYPPLVFGIEKGEPRVVCDFLEADVDKRVPAQIEAGGKFVNRITVARQSDPAKVRVELELVPNRHYDLQQLFFKEDNLFVVIVNELEGDEPGGTSGN